MNQYVLVTTDAGRLVLKSGEERPTVLEMQRRASDGWETVRMLARGGHEFELFLELVSTAQGEKVPDWDHL